MSPRFTDLLTPAAKSIKASEIRELLRIIRAKKDVISLAGGIPDPRYFPLDELEDIMRVVIKNYGAYSLQYSETKGVIELREPLAKYLYETKGFRVDAEEIIITSGSQQGLDLIGRTFISPGDIVITESPSYLAALGVFRFYGAKLIGIPIDENGMKVELLEEQLRKLRSEGVKPKFIYVIPVAQNPGGTTMSRDRKRYLVELASQYDLLLVEDDPYSYFVFDPTVDTTPLRTIDKEGRVIYMSTVSKILAPGLRIGWIASPPELARRLELVKQYMDLHSPTLNQYILLEALKRELLKKHATRLVEVYREKRDAMISAIEEYFPDYVWYSRPVGGFFVFAYINKPGFNATKLMHTAIEKYKVAYVPGQSFHPDGRGENSMRLSFSYPPPETIREGIKRIGRLIKEN